MQANTELELAKLFLSLEKQLIDFRINQIEQGNVSYGSASLGKEELKKVIAEVVREELKNANVPHECHCQDTSTVLINEPARISDEDIAHKVMETEPENVTPLPMGTDIIVEEIKKPVKTSSATSKGGTAFKVFEPLNLSSVSQNLEHNSVRMPEKSSVQTKAEVMSAVLS